MFNDGQHNFRKSALASVNPSELFGKSPDFIDEKLEKVHRRSLSGTTSNSFYTSKSTVFKKKLNFDVSKVPFVSRPSTAAIMPDDNTSRTSSFFSKVSHHPETVLKKKVIDRDEENKFRIIQTSYKNSLRPSTAHSSISLNPKRKFSLNSNKAGQSPFLRPSTHKPFSESEPRNKSANSEKEERLSSSKKNEDIEETHYVFGNVKKIRDVKAGHFNQREKKLGVFNLIQSILLREQQKLNQNLHTREKELIHNNVLRLGRDIKETAISMMQQLSGARKNIESLPNVDMFLKNFLNEAQKSQLIEFYLISMFVCGKISKSLQDYARAIGYFKLAKRMFPLGHMKLRCYKNIGACFQNLRKFYLALYYFKKLLQVAWYINSKEYELLAYDLIGVQFYYMEDLERSRFFHEKMMKGDFESSESPLRLLGISKLTNKKGFKNEIERTDFAERMRKRKNEKNLDRDNPAMAISSSDEDFDLPEPLSKEREKISVKQFEEMLNQKKSPSEDVFRMNPRNSKLLFRELTENANKNIRYKSKLERENSIFFINFKPGQKSSVLRANLQTIKQKVFTNQLTPNRTVEYFHQFEPRNITVYARSNSINELLCDEVGGGMKKQTIKKLKTFEYNFFLIINEVEVILNKFKAKSGPARKAAISIDKEVLETKGKGDYNIDVYNLY